MSTRRSARKKPTIPIIPPPKGDRTGTVYKLKYTYNGEDKETLFNRERDAQDYADQIRAILHQTWCIKDGIDAAHDLAQCNVHERWVYIFELDVY